MNFKNILNRFFLTIGSMKNYNQSLQNFADVLGKKLDPEYLNIKENVTIKDSNYHIPDESYRRIHQIRFPLEYEIYEYVNQKFNY